MITKSAKELIETWPLGFVASVDGEGRPNVSPKGTFVVLDDNTIAYADIRSPNTRANLVARPDVDVNFVDVLTRRGLHISGSARFVSRASEEYQMLRAPFSRRWPELEPQAEGLVLITVSACRPICTPAYDVGSEQDELRRHWMQHVQNVNIRHKSKEVAEC